ncbi:MAG TPA: hypothetical protein VE641_08885 [Chthoniobacterales bacterium]|nr:hypothetical protein [Chthoniobacterales bacterium]
MKIAQLGAVILALSLVVNVHAQNVGIGTGSPASKLTIIGNLAVGTDYNVAAPTNGALIEGTVGLGLTTPQVPLHVNGQYTWRGQAFRANSSPERRTKTESKSTPVG